MVLPMENTYKHPRLALGLIHYPILDQKKQTIATNVTNFDIHDIARACRVYGVERYYIIHPSREQLMFVERILDHWRVGQGSSYNVSRKKALENTFTAESLDKAIEDWNPQGPVLKIGTHARPVDETAFYTVPQLKECLWKKNQNVFLLFGTGFGLTQSYMQSLDGILESIRGAPPDDFRHLSVRSAVSIYLDRLLGSC